MHQGKDKPDDSAQEDHRYPFAGGPNPKVRLGVARLPELSGSGRARNAGAAPAPVWLDLAAAFDGDAEHYVARVHWLPGGDALAVHLVDRRQRRGRLVRFDARTGDATTLLDEKCYPGGWINVHDAWVCSPLPAF